MATETVAAPAKTQPTGKWLHALELQSALEAADKQIANSKLTLKDYDNESTRRVLTEFYVLRTTLDFIKDLEASLSTKRESTQTQMKKTQGMLASLYKSMETMVAEHHKIKQEDEEKYKDALVSIKATVTAIDDVRKALHKTENMLQGRMAIKKGMGMNFLSILLSGGIAIVCILFVQQLWKMQQQGAV